MKRKKLISTVEDLITSREETRAGFIAMALEKNFLATKYVDEAKALRSMASSVDHPKELLQLPDIRKALLSASGLSEKSLKYLTEEDKSKAILGLVETFLEPAGSNFPDELVYRYLLTKGDALGGSARNLAGSLGDRKFLRSLVSVFSLADMPFSWRDRKSKSWVINASYEPGFEKNMSALFWKKNSRNRLLAMNVTVPLIKKNVDLIILDAKPEEFTKTSRAIFEQNTRYVALGGIEGRDRSSRFR